MKFRLTAGRGPCTAPEITAPRQGNGTRQNRRRSDPIAFRYGQGQLRRPSTDKPDYQANKGAYVLKRSRKCGPYRQMALLASSEFFHAQLNAFSTSLIRLRKASDLAKAGKQTSSVSNTIMPDRISPVRYTKSEANLFLSYSSHGSLVSLS